MFLGAAIYMLGHLVPSSGDQATSFQYYVKSYIDDLQILPSETNKISRLARIIVQFGVLGQYVITIGSNY
jgi:hypothetical protein